MKLKSILRSQSSILFIASMGGIFCGLIASVLNTRYLSPEEYGNYRYVYNIITFICSFLLFGYFVSGSRLLAIAKSKKEIKQINGSMIIILLIAVLFIMLMMIPLYFIHKYYINQSVASLFLWAIPIAGSPLLMSYINTTFQGENRINELSCARLLPYFIYLPLGLLIYTNFGCSDIILMLLQNGSATIIYIILIIRLKPDFKNLGSTFGLLKKENKQYGLHVYFGSVLAVSLGYLSGITLGLFENNNTNVGYYTLALTMATPLLLLPGIVGTTHFKEFANEVSIKKRVIKNTVIITFLSLVLFIVMIIPLVKWIYSEDYSIVGYYACFLAIATSFHGFGDMFNRFLGAHGKGKEIRNGAIITGIIQTIGSIVLVYWLGIIGAIVTKIISSFVYFLLMLRYYIIVRKSLQGQ